MNAAGDEGRAKLNKQMDIIKKYMKGTWGIDMDQLRAIAQRRLEEVVRLPLIESSWQELLGSSLRGMPQAARMLAGYEAARDAVVEELMRHPKFLELQEGEHADHAKCQVITQYFH